MSETYLIDTSALMQIYVQDSFTTHAHALITLFEKQDEPDLHFLEIGLAEAANVLWKHVRRENIERQDARQAIADLHSLPLMIHPVQRYLADAFDLGLEHNLAVYDALYIVVAQDLDIPLITVDQRQAAVAENVGVIMKPLTDFVLDDIDGELGEAD